MEIILWTGLAITALIVIALIGTNVSVAWRLYRNTVDELQEQRNRIDRDRKRGARMTDHRYDPKQFRRR